MCKRSVDSRRKRLYCFKGKNFPDISEIRETSTKFPRKCLKISESYPKRVDFTRNGQIFTRNGYVPFYSWQRFTYSLCTCLTLHDCAWDALARDFRGCRAQCVGCVAAASNAPQTNPRIASCRRPAPRNRAPADRRRRPSDAPTQVTRRSAIRAPRLRVRLDDVGRPSRRHRADRTAASTCARAVASGMP